MMFAHSQPDFSDGPAVKEQIIGAVDKTRIVSPIEKGLQ
jgi:hypothetical protein